MAKEKKVHKKMSAKALTGILVPVIAVLLAVAIAISIIPTMFFDGVMRDFFGEAESSSTATTDTSGLDTTYVKSDYSSLDAVKAAASEYTREASGEGFVLLMNDTENGGLPIETSSSNKTELALFSQSSTDFIIGGTGSGTASSDVTLKTALEASNYTVNSDLWNYYSNSGYSRGAGSINYGGSENWAINEVPLATLQNNVALGSISSKTTALFILSRTGGEGRDLGRAMDDYTDIAADQTKHYLEPDSVELEIINYLNNNFENVILIVNTNNVMELGWVSNYENINAVLWVPGGGDQAAYGLADILSGAVSPSGHLVDTMAYDSFSSPAMQNMGDIAYTVDGSTTGYYGVSYDEGIYVGYKYYETRYYDAVKGQGNATSAAGVYGSTGGVWNYAEEVQYTFGYGLSYTEFEWSNLSGSYSSTDDTITISVDVKNVGDVAGKDVVQIYLNAPYTVYDQTHHIEKAAATLVGYAKTQTLAAGASETVTVTVDVSDLTSYDDVNLKTYILEDGDYLLTAATDAHEAVNNVLAYEAANGDTSVDASKMTSTGNSALVYSWNNASFDSTTYAVSAVGAEITNRFDGAATEGGSNYIDRDKYLSRQDWSGTWPVTHGTQDAKAESSMSEVNGYQFREEISSELLAKLQQKGTAEAANSPMTDDEAAAITASQGLSYGNTGTHELIDYRGLDFDEADWTAIVSMMTTSEVGKTINLSGYTTPVAQSINKPKATDLDGPAGLNNMVGHSNYSIAYPAEVTIAATWNVEIAEKHGYFVGEDGLQLGVSGWYAPAMNIHRTPFAGRNFEYYSEDAYLSGNLAAATVTAAAEKGVYSFVKHFALNDQEDHRCDNGIATWCNEQAMREIYLRPFQKVSEAGTVEVSYYETNDSGEMQLTTAQIPAMQAVMSSFNRVGATWAGGSYQLITEILRNEWGFNGFVLTDYSQGSTGYMHTAQMLRAGADCQLSQYGTNYKISDDATIYYTQQAMSHVLYTVVNSNVMNGFIHGVAASADPFAYYYIIIIVVDVLCAAGIVVSGVALGRRWHSESKAKKAAKGN